ncbi:MAG: hypothetical protein Q8P28_11070 [Deltaproteobacteria bacterium]|nr:hypothetical protein [Deltaproteobacteria bacterium]
MFKLPPPWVILSCLLLFGFGELGGALLGRYPQPIKDLTQKQVLAHPDVHGLTGVPDIDRTIFEKTGTEVLARVHTFHFHSHGLALVVFVLCLILVNMDISNRFKKVLMGLTCLGLGYPFGWLTIAITLPLYGKTAAFRLAERLFFIPFGGGFLGVVWLIILIYFIKQVGNFKRSKDVKNGGRS